MGKFTLTNKAVEDLGDIWTYTCERWSEQQADKYYQQLLDACQEVADDPKLGRHYEGVHPQLRGMPMISHVVFFRELGLGAVEITRILHGRMDLKRRNDE